MGYEPFYDKYFTGVPEDQIEAVNSFNPTEKFEKNGDTYTYYTQEAKGHVEIKFKSGVEFDYVLMDEPVSIWTLYIHFFIIAGRKHVRW